MRMVLLTIISSILIVIPVWVIIIISIMLIVLIINVTKGKQIAKEKHHLV